MSWSNWEIYIKGTKSVSWCLTLWPAMTLEQQKCTFSLKWSETCSRFGHVDSHSGLCSFNYIAWRNRYDPGAVQMIDVFLTSPVKLCLWNSWWLLLQYASLNWRSVPRSYGVYKALFQLKSFTSWGVFNSDAVCWFFLMMKN